MEQLEHEAVAQVRQRRVKARSLVAHEGVGPVELVPSVGGANLFQLLPDQDAPLERDVRVLPAPDHQQFALDVAGALKAVVAIPLPELMVVDVGRVKAGGSAHVRVHPGAKRKMAPKAKPPPAGVAG